MGSIIKSFSIFLPNGIQKVKMLFPNSDLTFAIYPLSNVLIYKFGVKMYVFALGILLSPLNKRKRTDFLLLHIIQSRVVS